MIVYGMRRPFRRTRQVFGKTRMDAAGVRLEWRWNVSRRLVRPGDTGRVACKSFTRVCERANEPEQATWLGFDVGRSVFAR